MYTVTFAGSAFKAAQTKTIVVTKEADAHTPSEWIVTDFKKANDRGRHPGSEQQIQASSTYGQMMQIRIRWGTVLKSQIIRNDTKNI